MKTNITRAGTADAIRDKTEHMKDFLRGYGRSDGKALLPLMAYAGWKAAACTALAERRERILELFDDETLALIAQGEISVSDVAANVAEEMGAL